MCFGFWVLSDLDPKVKVKGQILKSKISNLKLQVFPKKMNIVGSHSTTIRLSRMTVGRTSRSERLFGMMTARGGGQ